MRGACCRGTGRQRQEGDPNPMKLVLFNDFRPGVLTGDGVVDLGGLLPDLAELTAGEVMPAVITRFADLRSRIEDLAAKGGGTALAGVRLRAPLARPRKLLCAVGNYYESGTKREPDPQDFFIKSPEAVIGHGDTVVLPPHQASIFHHEAELAVVIGRPAKYLTERTALDTVFGYTGFIDVSARDLGRPVGQSFLGKSFDTFAPLGPCLVTADEIPDPQQLHVQLWVDGKIRHDYHTSDMMYPVPSLLTWLTGYMALQPGDVVACGTNHQGIGPIQDGETVDLEIERIGRLQVKVSDPLKRQWERKIDEEMAARARQQVR